MSDVYIIFSIYMDIVALRLDDGNAVGYLIVFTYQE